MAEGTLNGEKFKPIVASAVTEVRLSEGISHRSLEYFA